MSFAIWRPRRAVLFFSLLLVAGCASPPTPAPTASSAPLRSPEPSPAITASASAVGSSAPAPPEPVARGAWKKVPLSPSLHTIPYDFKKRARVGRTVVDTEEEVRVVCGAKALFGDPEATAYHDVVYAASSPAGVELAIRINPEYGWLELLGDHPKDDEIEAFVGGLRAATANDCELRYAEMATAIERGIRGGKVFRRDASPDDGLRVHAARVQRAAEVPSDVYAKDGSEAWRTDDWALSYLVDNATEFAKNRSALEEPFTLAFLRWTTHSPTVGMSDLARQAVCDFVVKLRHLLPGITSAQRNAIASARCP